MKFKKYINEEIKTISLGDYVKELPNGPFGNKGTGRVLNDTGSSWTVKFPNNKDKYEYHRGELALIKKGNFVLINEIQDKADQINDFIYIRKNFKKAYNLLEKLKKEAEVLSVELKTII